MTARRKAGFTLLEVMLVVALLAILAGVTVFVIGGRSDDAKIKLARTLVEGIVPKALEEYNMALNSYPTDDQGLGALVSQPAEDQQEGGNKWKGPYLDPKQIVDPWDQPLGYRLMPTGQRTADGKAYQVWSNGPDKTSETEDDVRGWKDETSG